MSEGMQLLVSLNYVYKTLHFSYVITIVLSNTIEYNTIVRLLVSPRWGFSGLNLQYFVGTLARLLVTQFTINFMEVKDKVRPQHRGLRPLLLSNRKWVL